MSSWRRERGPSTSSSGRSSLSSRFVIDHRPVSCSIDHQDQIDTLCTRNLCIDYRFDLGGPLMVYTFDGKCDILCEQYIIWWTHLHVYANRRINIISSFLLTFANKVMGFDKDVLLQTWASKSNFWLATAMIGVPLLSFATTGVLHWCNTVVLLVYYRCTTGVLLHHISWRWNGQPYSHWKWSFFSLKIMA